MGKQGITLLTEGQIWGNSEENQISALEDYGTKCSVTDFVITLGGYVAGDNFSPEGNNLEDRTGICWTSSSDGGGCVRSVYKDGSKEWSWPYIRRCAIRPVLPFSMIEHQFSDTYRGYNGTDEIEYGEYPQMAVSQDLQQMLEQLFADKALQATGRSYTTDSRKHNDNDNGFLAQNHKEYNYEGRRFIRVKGNSDFGNKAFILSNGVSYHNGDMIWVEVQPIKWLVDSGGKILVSKKALLAGIRYNPRGVCDGNFEDTELQEYLIKYLLKDILYISVANDIRKEHVQYNKKRNPFDFSFVPVSEEDIVKGAIQSDISVFLHGQSSVGKSARVKQLDPDCHVLYLRNATPESLIGKSVYDPNSGELMDVPPNWYKQVCKKCEQEPDKIHIVFFDEITNALYSIQGMAFNIILDKEVNGIFKLPDNCRVVAAGNDLNDSLAANVLVEPLFNRFAHVYIETPVKSWLKWATVADKKHSRLNYMYKPRQKHKIHPVIYAFIAYRGEKALRSEYTGEKPNADPRKWEFASTLLYNTKKPEMLRALVGERITKDFIHFCNQKVITLQDVIANNYNEKDLNLNTAEKYLTAAALSFANEENLIRTRRFVSGFGPEYVAVFDSLYSYGDEKRLEKIIELRTSNLG